MLAQDQTFILIGRRQEEGTISQEDRAKMLQNDLTQTRNKIHKLQSSIKQKHKQMSSISQTLNKLLNKQKPQKDKPSNFLQIMRLADTNPTLHQKHQTLLKIHAEIEQARIQLLERKIEKESGISQQGESRAVMLLRRQEKVRELEMERETVRGQVRMLQAVGDDQNEVYVREVQKELEAIRKEVKRFQKEIHQAEREGQFLDSYSSFLYGDIADIEKTAERNKVKPQKNFWKQQIDEIRELNNERAIFQKKSAVQLQSKQKQFELVTATSEQLKIKFRQIQNMIMRTELDIKALSRPIKQRTYSSNNLQHINNKNDYSEKKMKQNSSVVNLKKPVLIINKKSEGRIELKLGNPIDTQQSVWITNEPLTEDPTIKIHSIGVFQTNNYTLCGLSLKFKLNDQTLLPGKPMTLHNPPPQIFNEFLLQDLSSITFQYNDSQILAMWFTPLTGQSQVVGTPGSGVSRVIHLSEFNFAYIDTKLETMEDGMVVISGMRVVVERKEVMRRSLGQGAMQLDEFKNQRWRSVTVKRQTELPKIDFKKIIDHRLGIYEGRK